MQTSDLNVQLQQALSLKQQREAEAQAAEAQRKAEQEKQREAELLRFFNRVMELLGLPAQSEPKFKAEGAVVTLDGAGWRQRSNSRAPSSNGSTNSFPEDLSNVEITFSLDIRTNFKPNVSRDDSMLYYFEKGYEPYRHEFLPRKTLYEMNASSVRRTDGSYYWMPSDDLTMLRGMFAEKLLDAQEADRYNREAWDQFSPWYATRSAELAKEKAEREEQERIEREQELKERAEQQAKWQAEAEQRRVQKAAQDAAMTVTIRIDSPEYKLLMAIREYVNDVVSDREWE